MTIDPDLWRQADAILDALLDLPAPERDARIAALACAPALQSAVKQLWAEHDGRGGVLDHPPIVHALPLEGLQGRRLGR